MMNEIFLGECCMTAAHVSIGFVLLNATKECAFSSTLQVAFVDVKQLLSF